jgi:oligosaccharide repeat unit polymerase
MYATGMFGYNFVQWWYRQPWHDVPKTVFDRYRPSFANAVVVFLGFVGVVLFALKRGVSFGFRIDRWQATLLTTQGWVVLMFIMNGFVMYMMMGWRTMTRQARVLLVLTIVAFIVVQTFFGNRRDYLPMFICLAGIFATRRHMIIRLRHIILGLFVFVTLTVLGVVRMIMDSPMLILSDPIKLLITQNEFVSPIQTLMYYVDRPHPLRWGWTYFSAPSLFIPRSMWPEKPESLSLQFMRAAFGTTGMMGYAYTPVTEAFLNFGFVGPFIVFSILSILLVKLVKNADVRPGFYFLCFAFVLDFNRGDVGGLFYSLVCAGTAFYFMSQVSKLRWAPKALRDAWPQTAPAYS